jgi:hypothetical protein
MVRHWRAAAFIASWTTLCKNQGPKGRAALNWPMRS